MTLPRSRPVVAIIGAGLMGRWHAFSAHRLGAEIAVVVDPDRARAQTLAKRFPGTKAASSLAELERSDVAAIHVCSPLATHVALAREAIEAGRHVLMEKPLAPDAEQTRLLADAALAHAVILCPVHQMAFQRGTGRAAAALARIGRVATIQVQIASAGGSAPGAALDEIVADILPHPLSLLQALWPHAALEADSWTITHPRAGELLISGVHAGALLSIAISMHARPPCLEMIVQGDGGTIVLDLFHGFSVVRPGRVSRFDKAARPFSHAAQSVVAAASNLGARALDREPAYPGLRALVQHFYAAIAGAAPPPIALAAAIEAAVARDRVRLSMAAA